VGADTPAQAAGLREGDLLLSAQGTPVCCVDDLQRIMVLSETDELRVDVFRKERRRVVTVRPSIAAKAA
jgi:S1-C subfamily serine protease